MRIGLTYKWLIFNLFVTGNFIAAYYYELLDRYISDKTYFTQGIMLLAAFIIIMSGKSVWKLRAIRKTISDRKANYTHSLMTGRSEDFKDVLSSVLENELSLFRIAGPILVTLGLLGTITGVIIGFSGLVGADFVNNADESNKVIQTLMFGLNTAFTTTYWGMIGMLWNLVNLTMMKSEASSIFSEIVDPRNP